MSKGISVTGKKAYQCLDDYETYEIGSVIEPWTFIQDRIGYYTEGNPLVTNERPFNGTKSLSIKKGKIELMFDWGGVWNDGYYTISFMTYKASGSFNFIQILVLMIQFRKRKGMGIITIDRSAESRR